MVGDGVLHECLADSRVTSILAVTRSPLGITNPKLKELRRTDFFNYDDLARELSTIDACFFCLGVSAAGMKEAQYHRLTFDLTLAAARALAKARPGAVFCYVSGEATDSTERGRTMIVGVELSALRPLFLSGPDATASRRSQIRVGRERYCACARGRPLSGSLPWTAHNFDLPSPWCDALG